MRNIVINELSEKHNKKKEVIKMMVGETRKLGYTLSETIKLINAYYSKTGI